MKLERTKNAKRNILFSLLNKMISLFFPFIVRMVVIRRIGADYLGLDSLFISVLQVLSLTELGFSSAAVYSMYKPVAENDEEALCRLLKFYRTVYLKIGVIFLVCGIILIPFLPKMIQGNWPNDVNIYLLYFIYLINSAISYWLFAYRQSLLEAYQRVDVVQIINIIAKAFTYIGQILVLLLFGNYYFYAEILICGTILTNICNYLCTRKLFPNIRCEGNLGKDEKSLIKEKIKGLMISRLCMVSRNTFDSIFISMFLGLMLTAVYGNYYHIMTAVTGIMLVISSSIQAGIGNSIVTESIEKNYNDLCKFNFVYMWLGGWFTACLLNLYQPFSELIFGENMLLPFQAVALFCIYFYFLKVGDIISAYFSARGLWWENRYRSVVECAMNLALNYLLGKYFGIYGILLATILSIFFINIIWGSRIIFHYYFGKEKIIDYYRKHLIYGLSAFGGCILTYYICSFVENTGVLALVLKVVICTVVPNVFFILIYCRTKMFCTVRNWIKQVIAI